MPFVPTEFAETCGEAIRRLRRARRVVIRQLDLAIDVGVDHSMVSRWETGGVLPTSAQLADIRRSLQLTDEEFESLRSAWARDSQTNEAHAPSDEMTPSALLESLQISLECARTLRKSGQPRMARLVSARDAQFAFQALKRYRWTTEHRAALKKLSEVLLEQCKAGLDFLTREEVRQGMLSDALQMQSSISEVCSGEATVFLDIAREGVAYVGGNVGHAKMIGELLISSHKHIPPGWLPEVIRAMAINAGALVDAPALVRAHQLLDRLTQERSEEFSGGTHTFVLEGFARGWGRIDPANGIDVLAKAWDLRDKSRDLETDSKLRYVQLVRSQAELELSLRSSHNLGDTMKRISSALSISSANGYDRYIQQLQILEKRMQRL